MKYVVTDEAIAAWSERHDLSFGGSSVDARAAFEDAQSFAQTIGEPGAVPDALRVVVHPSADTRAYIDDLNVRIAYLESLTTGCLVVPDEKHWDEETEYCDNGHDIGGGLFIESERDVVIWNACREAMLSAAPHHPTTEKGAFKIMAAHVSLDSGQQELKGHGCKTVEEADDYVRQFSGNGESPVDSPRLWVEKTNHGEGM